MDNKNVIGQRINTALAHFDIKQKELAAYLGVPANTISYFCKGSRTPSVQQVIQMSVFFMVPSDWFLGLLPLDYIDVNDESNKFDTRGFTIAQRNVLGEISDMTEGLAIRWLLDDYRIQKDYNTSDRSLLSLLGKFFRVAGYDPACPDLVFKLKYDGHLQMKTYNRASPQAERNMETHIKGINREYSFTEFILQQHIYDIDKALHSMAQHATLVLEYARKSPVEVKYITQKEDHDEKS